MPPDQTVGAELARDGGLIGGEIVAGVHIHSCGNGFYWFRPYGESLGKAPSNQTLLPLSSGASLGLGIPSLRSSSVGPPRSAIHGRARLTRHPCRVAHCAEPALGLTRGQEDQKPKQSKAKQSNNAFFSIRHFAPSQTATLLSAIQDASYSYRYCTCRIFYLPSPLLPPSPKALPVLPALSYIQSLSIGIS